MEQENAEALWTSLRDALANVEEAIKSIVAAKAWKPLGYETFAEGWADALVRVLQTPDDALIEAEDDPTEKEIR